jgi:Uma2 family endonuclease
MGGGCDVYGGDMRVKVNALGKYTYPDLSIVCGEQIFEDAEVDTLVNPTVIIEVLSKSTEQYDRGKKFEHYRAMESLREYVLIAQDEPRVEKFVRMEDGTWSFTDVAGLDGTILLSSVGFELRLVDIYARVDFSA